MIEVKGRKDGEESAAGTAPPRLCERNPGKSLAEAQRYGENGLPTFVWFVWFMVGNR